MNAMRNGNRNKSRENAKVRCSAVAARENSGFGRWDRRVGFEGRAAEFPGPGLLGSELVRVADRTEGQNGERRKRQRGERPASAAVAQEDADIHVTHPNRMDDAGLPFLTQVKQPRWPAERSVRRLDSHDEQRRVLDLDHHRHGRHVEVAEGAVKATASAITIGFVIGVSLPTPHRAGAGLRRAAARR